MCGGGSGGGSVTTVPTYIKDRHKIWLDECYEDMKDTARNNPYIGAHAYDPSVLTDGMLAALNAFCGALSGFHYEEVEIGAVSEAYGIALDFLRNLYNGDPAWERNMEIIVPVLTDVHESSTYLAAAVDEYGDELQADIDSKVLPRFQAGMRDANAVMSSSFVLGEALIMAEKGRNVAKYAADLHLAAHTARNKAIVDTGIAMIDTDIKAASVAVPLTRALGDFYIQGIEFKRHLTHMVLDTLRIIIVAKKEQNDDEIKLNKAGALWVIEMYQYAGSLLGAYQGTYSVQKGVGSEAGLGTALSGAMSGASAGFSVGGPWGALLGGVGGAIGGLLHK